MEIDCKNAQITNVNNETLEITFKYNQMSFNEFLLFKHLLKNNFCRNRISKPRKPRTTGKYSQNAHFNGHIQQICIETGNSFGSVKMYCKKQAIDRGYPFESFKGEIVPMSEADADTIQANMLIDTVHQLADELGIKLKEN